MEETSYAYSKILKAFSRFAKGKRYTGTQSATYWIESMRYGV